MEGPGDVRWRGSDVEARDVRFVEIVLGKKLVFRKVTRYTEPTTSGHHALSATYALKWMCAQADEAPGAVKLHEVGEGEGALEAMLPIVHPRLSVRLQGSSARRSQGS